MMIPLVDKIKAWVPCITNEAYHRPISVVTAVACAALAVFAAHCVAHAEVISLLCGSIGVCTLAVAYKATMLTLSYFNTQPVIEPSPGIEKHKEPSRPASPEGFETVGLFKPLTAAPKD